MLTLWVCHPIQLRGGGGGEGGRIRASHLPYHALQCYIPLSLTNCHSSCFLFLFLVCFLMNELLLSYLLYPFAQLARAENTIILFRLPFGWFFMKRSRVHMKHHPNGNLKNSMVFSALPNHLSSCPSVLPVVKFGNASVKLNSTCTQPPTPPPPSGLTPGH